MKKIGDVTSTADKNGEWTNGNVAAGIAPTILEAGWLNSVQREILGVLVEAGITQDKNNDNQLKDAIKKIISGGDYATKTEVNSKLAKDQNGADIPNKDTFIKNLGLPELLNKKFDKTGGEITGDIILNDGTAKQDVKIRAWGATDRETVFEVDFGDEYAFHVSKYKDGPVSAVFKGTVTPGDYSNFDSRYVGKSTFEQVISSLPKNTALKANNGWFKDGATGLIIQWGKVTDTGEGKSWLDFPIPFPNACVNIQVTVNAVGVPSNNYSTVYRIELNGAEIGRDQNGSWWVAIGW